MSLTAKRGERGFTLIEMVIVVAIIGIIAVIATISVSQTLKKQRLEAAANQFQSFVESAAVFSRERSCGVFVWLHRGPSPDNLNQWWYCYLIADTNRNDILEFNLVNPWEEPPGLPAAADGDEYLRTEKIQFPSDIEVAPPTALNPGEVWPGPNNWPANPNDAADYLILCDPRGLPFNPNGPQQILGPSVISITHQEMITGQLSPGIRYDLTVSPLWHTRQNVVIY